MLLFRPQVVIMTDAQILLPINWYIFRAGRCILVARHLSLSLSKVKLWERPRWDGSPSSAPDWCRWAPLCCAALPWAALLWGRETVGETRVGWNNFSTHNYMGMCVMAQKFWNQVLWRRPEQNFLFLFYTRMTKRSSAERDRKSIGLIWSLHRNIAKKNRLHRTHTYNKKLVGYAKPVS